MSGNTENIGSVLGATTALAGGVALLPYTGGINLVSILSLTAIVLGLVVLTSFITTRIIKKLVK